MSRVTPDTLLAAALRSRRGFSVLRRAVTSDLAVPDGWKLRIMRWAAEHVDSYGDVPRQGDADLWIEGQPEESREALRSAWRTLARQDLSDFSEDHLLDRAGEVFREAATRTATHRLARLTDPDPEAFEVLAEEIRGIRPVHLDGLADLADYDAHLRYALDSGRRVPSGIEKLDQYLGGGFEQELVFLMASTGGGKTTWIVNRLLTAALYGARCLHVTLELATKKTLHRYYRRIAEARREDFIADVETVRDSVAHWTRFAEGSVHVLYLPAYGPTVEDIRGTVEVFAEMHGGIDVLAVDYLDLLGRPRSMSRLRTDEQLGILSHELRNICSDMDAEVVTASQANREGMDASKLSLKHMAGAIAKAQAADVVLGLVQDEDEAEVDQARLGLLKMRDHPGKGAEIPLHFHMDTMTIMDLDHPDARRRRAEIAGFGR